jgi:hypothetical protein
VLAYVHQSVHKIDKVRESARVFRVHRWYHVRYLPASSFAGSSPHTVPFNSLHSSLGCTVLSGNLLSIDRTMLVHIVFKTMAEQERRLSQDGRDTRAGRNLGTVEQAYMHTVETGNVQQIVTRGCGNMVGPREMDWMGRSPFWWILYILRAHFSPNNTTQT